MKDLVLKFSLLDTVQQEQLLDFMDFLLLKKKENKPAKSNDFNWVTYKQGLLNMPVWSEKDLQVFDENRKNINEW